MRAFLSYLYGVDVTLVSRAIRDANWEVLDSLTVSSGTPLSVREWIATADAVIVAGGGPGSPDSGALLLEVGIALGLNKPVLFLWDEIAAPPMALPPEIRLARISLRNLDALRFHIGVFLAETKAGSTAAPTKIAIRASPVDINRLAARLVDLQATPSIKEADFVAWIEDVFRSVGSKSVPTPHPDDRGFDLVLSAPSTSDVAGPVLVEAKTRWPPANQLRSLVERLANVVASERAGLGVVVILARADTPKGSLARLGTPRVTILSADDLLKNVLSQESLADALIPPGWTSEPNL